MTSIIFIDDDIDLCKAFTVYMEGANYKVFTAHTGEQGLLLAKTHFPDLIILDIELPGKNGIEILKMFKAHDALAEIPIVMFTSHAKREYVATTVKLGITDYLVKPIDMKKLYERIRRTLLMLNLQKEIKENKGYTKIDVKRHNNITTLTVLGKIKKTLISDFKNLITKSFLLQSRYDNIVLDLRFQPYLDETQIKILEGVLKILESENPKILAGRNYSNFLNLDIDIEKQLFISEDDLEKILTLKFH